MAEAVPPPGPVPPPPGPPEGALGGAAVKLPLQKALPLVVVAGITGVSVLMAMEDPFLAVAGLCAAFLGLVVLSTPSLATPCALFLLYSNLTVVAVRFHGLPGVLNLASPALLAVPLASNLLLHRRKIIIDPVLPLLILFLVVQILGTLYARNFGTAKSELITFVLEGILLFFLVTNTVRDRRSLRMATWALLLVGFATSLVPAYQQLTDTYSSDYGGFGQTEVVGFRTEPGSSKFQGRAAGTIGEQNRYAQNMLMILPLGYFLARRETSKRLRRWAIIFTGVTAVGFLLTFSRGGLVALGMILALMAFMRFFTRRHLLILAAGGFLTLLALPTYINRIASFARISNFQSRDVAKGEEADGAVKGRVTEMLAAAMVFADHPLVGVGPGMFQYYSEEYGNRLGIRKLEGERQAHCLYLEVAAESGALGLACFLAMIFITLHGLLTARAFHRRKGTPDNPAEDATPYLLALICYLFSAIFLHLSFIRFFYVILGLAAAAARIEGPGGEPEAGDAADASLIPRPAVAG